MISAIKAGINKNITNPVGVLLLKQNYYYMDVADLDPLMPQILQLTTTTKPSSR